MVLKVAASDPVSRQTGVALGLYEREVRFYAEVAPRLVGPIAPCYHASFDAEAGTFALLLGDAGPAEVGDEIEGTSLERARLAVSELGRLHGPAIGDPTLAGAAWLNRESPIGQALMAQLYAGFIERYESRIAPRHRKVCDRLIASFDAYLAADDGGPAGPGARRLPPRQHAVRHAGRGPAADGRRLADRQLGTGDDRSGVFPGVRAAGAAASRARRGADRVLPPRARSRDDGDAGGCPRTGCDGRAFSG